MPLEKKETSIVVLTYKRQDELLRTLESICTKNGKGVEIIVVNNHNDDTDVTLKNRYPEIKCINVGENKGCEARNIGIQNSRGDIIITLDNDVNMKSEGFVEKVEKFFDKHPSAGCINFKVLKPGGGLSLRDWCHPRDYPQWSGLDFKTDHVSEGASAFRKDAFLRVGGYFAPFFIGHEGPDLGLRLIKQGFEVWYSPDIEVTHHASPDARPDWRVYYYNTRNDIWLAYRHYPVFYALKYTTFYTGMAFFYSLKDYKLTAFVKGVIDGIRGMRGLERDVLNGEGLSRLKEVVAYKPSVLSRIRKHLLSRQAYR
jgi:GT2 family glycosyltransferase